MATTEQQQNRIKLFYGLKKTTIKGGEHFWNSDHLFLDQGVLFKDFFKTYFSNQEVFEEFYNGLTATVTTDNEILVDMRAFPIEDFYSEYACDLKWAAGTQPCIDAGKSDKQVKTQSVQQTQEKPTQPADSTVQKQQPVNTTAQQTQPQTQTSERPKLNFRQCQGTYTPGCVNTDAIAQVQRCLDLTTPKHPRGSGYYDYILHDKLSSMGFKNGFTDADVSKICDMESTKTKPFQTQENDEPGQENETPRQTYEKYYAKLDGKETNRVKLKLSNIPDNDLQNLNKYFVTQGLYKIINPKRRYGTKFVWGKKTS